MHQAKVGLLYPPLKLHALVELITKMHEIAVAVDAAAAAAVDAAAASDRLVSGNGGGSTGPVGQRTARH